MRLPRRLTMRILACCKKDNVAFKAARTKLERQCLRLRDQLSHSGNVKPFQGSWLLPNRFRVVNGGLYFWIILEWIIVNDCKKRHFLLMILLKTASNCVCESAAERPA